MNYYTSTIPVTLAEKLKEKGMPMSLWQQGGYDFIEVLEKRQEIFDDSTYEVAVRYEVPLYCEVYDWFLDKHEAFVYVTCLRMDEGWQYCGGIWGFGIDMTLGWKSTWHEAANAAIEKALTLI